MIRRPSRSREFLDSLPLTSRCFIALGVTWSVIVHLFSALPVSGSGLAGPWVVLTCVGIIISGLLLCLITSTHWFIYGWLSVHRPHGFFMLSAGLLMLACDVYARTHTAFITTNSTDPTAVVFIPIVIGGSVLPVTFLTDLIVVKR